MRLFMWSVILDYKIEKIGDAHFIQFARKTKKLLGIKFVGHWYFVQEKQNIHEIFESLTPDYLLFPIAIIEMYKQEKGRT